MILIVVAVAIVLFVIGMVFLLQGYSHIPNADLLVPVEQFKKEKDEHDAAAKQAEELKQQVDSLTVELEETKERLAEAQNTRQSALAETDEVRNSLQEKERGYERKVHKLEQDLKFLTQKADIQAQNAIEVLEILDAESETLKQQAAAQPDPAENEQLVSDNQALKNEVEEAHANINQLEDKVSLASKQLIDKDTVINNLSAEKEKLDSGLKQITAKIQEVETEFGKAHQEYADQLAQANEKINKFKEENQVLQESNAVGQSRELEEINQVKEEQEKSLAAVNEQNRQLQEQLQTLHTQIADNEFKIGQLNEVLAQSRQEQEQTQVTINELREDKQKLQEQVADEAALLQVQAAAATGPRQEEINLANEVKKLKELNDYLSEKEKILQFEFTKSRAQAMGLEKICDEFKVQMEGKQKQSA